MLHMSSVPDGIPAGTIKAPRIWSCHSSAPFTHGMDDGCPVSLVPSFSEAASSMISDATMQQRTRLQSRNPLTYHAITQQPPELL
jgi:hypothetical protein